ncbi:hypothetical protein [Winogradskyella alexanderae]|uniref:Secreted protein n=1 Tax=Winogradskyella alexanderae TaxID=2877123 RepID=A0ABS7XT86_9FLAO|nr:hypothetical protein [Winogradskyella alexanderae]MCA0132142.1 hypothetical protein [Winogradskyella alexanderae]
MRRNCLTYIVLSIIIILLTNCSNDDDCPNEIIADIDDPESIERAEDCGLSPAEQLGEEFWLYNIAEVQ